LPTITISPLSIFVSINSGLAAPTMTLPLSKHPEISPHTTVASRTDTIFFNGVFNNFK
jgi:hypothetical protein